MTGVEQRPAKRNQAKRYLVTEAEAIGDEATARRKQRDAKRHGSSRAGAHECLALEQGASTEQKTIGRYACLNQRRGRTWKGSGVVDAETRVLGFWLKARALLVQQRRR